MYANSTYVYRVSQMQRPVVESYVHIDVDVHLCVSRVTIAYSLKIETNGIKILNVHSNHFQHIADCNTNSKRTTN